MVCLDPEIKTLPLIDAIPSYSSSMAKSIYANDLVYALTSDEVEGKNLLFLYPKEEEYIAIWKSGMHPVRMYSPICEFYNNSIEKINNSVVIENYEKPGVNFFSRKQDEDQTIEDFLQNKNKSLDCFNKFCQSEISQFSLSNSSFNLFWTYSLFGYPRINVAVNNQLDLSDHIADLFYKTSLFNFQGEDYDQLVGGIGYLIDKIVFKRLKS